MVWFGTQNFPAAVSNAMLPGNTLIHGRYAIRCAEVVSGIEMTYMADDLKTGTPCCLHQLLPMRWCRKNENGRWVPYHGKDHTEYEQVLSVYTERIRVFMGMEETALPNILDVFEESGTVCYVTEQTDWLLTDMMADHLYTPNRAIEALTGIMDSLAGMHEKGICHGAITAGSIRFTEQKILLADFGAFLSEGITEPTPETDIASLSRLLFHMTTGVREYDAETAKSLPPAFRSAIASGLAGEIHSIEDFWKRLHDDSIEKRSRMILPGGNLDKAAKFLNWKTALVFCLLCCLIPILVQPPKNAESTSIASPEYEMQIGMVKVPEVLYLSREEAIERLESLGFAVIICGREANPVAEENSILTQYPCAGAAVSAGSTVELIVSDGWFSYVPDLRNMLVQDAIEKLTELGFLVECTEVENEEAVPGSVITQDVKPDERLERGSKIHLTISLGGGEIDENKMEKVGDYVGMNFDEVKQELAKVHLYAYQAKTIYSKEVPAGIIIAQQVPKDASVRQGTILNFAVSLGEELVRVPKVEMMSTEAAQKALEDAGLKAVVCYESNGEYSMDYVMAQSAEAGKMLPIGTEIWLTVSIGTSSTVQSTGGWSGNPLPMSGEEETEEEPAEQQPEEDPGNWEEPDDNDYDNGDDPYYDPDYDDGDDYDYDYDYDDYGYDYDEYDYE